MLVYPEGILYAGVRQDDIDVIIDEHLIGGTPVTRLYPTPEAWSNEP